MDLVETIQGIFPPEEIPLVLDFVSRAALPILAAAAFYFLVLKTPSGRRQKWDSHFFPSLLIATICLAFQIDQQGWPGIPPKDSGLWPLWLALPAGLPLMFPENKGKYKVFSLLFFVALFFLTCYLVLQPLTSGAISPSVHIHWSTMAAYLGCLFHFSLASLTHQGPTWSPLLFMLMVAALAGKMFLLAGSASLAEQTGTLAFAIFALGGVGLLFKQKHIAQACLPSWMILLSGQVLVAWQYVEISATGLYAMMLSFLLYGLSALPVIKNKNLWHLMVIGLCALVMAWGLVEIYQAAPAGPW